MAAVGECIRVLVIEDEESYRLGLASGLGREGFAVEMAPDGAEGLRLFTDHPPDIVLLDMLLPGMHGIEVCRRMRAIAPVPIVVLSAVDSELDVVLGFELGAAGYVSQPFRLRELVARMHAILRRVSPRVDPLEVIAVDHPAVVHGGVPDEQRPEAAFGSVAVDFVRRELIDLLWPDRDLSDSRTLDTHVHRLRTKLEPDPADPQYIVTVRGVGFRIDPDGTRVAPPSRRAVGAVAAMAPTVRHEPLSA